MIEPTESPVYSGPGAIFLAGPPLTGKGTLSRFLMTQGIPETNNIGIGSALRAIKDKIRADPAAVEEQWGISQTKLISRDVEPELDRLAARNNVDVSLMTEQDWFIFTLAKGDLLPTKWVVPLFEEKISHIDETQPILLDGTPRRLSETQMVLRVLAQKQIPLLHYFEFVFEEDPALSVGEQHQSNIEKLIERTGGNGREAGREDDHPDIVVQRYYNHLETVVPALDFLKTAIDSPEHITLLPISLPKEGTRARVTVALASSIPMPLRADVFPTDALDKTPTPAG